MAITVSLQDVNDSVDFLQSYLTDSIPDGEYGAGSALRDLAVKAIAFVVAYLKKNNDQIRVRQSLLSVLNVDTSDDATAASDAVDQILSNWFLTRNQGKLSRVLAYAHSSVRADMVVSASSVFYRTSSLAFLLDNDGEDLYIPATDLLAQFDSSGVVSDYVFRIPLVSARSGAAFNIDPGMFVSFSQFSPYVSKVETLEKATGGDGVEATESFISRSKNATTVRNLINARSCDTVLRDTFPDITRVQTIGMGDAEMIRDLARDEATGLTMHVGGHMDVFVDLPVNETSFSGVVGSTFTRPDGAACVFHDTTYADYSPGNPTGHKFTDPDTTTGITPLPGMVLRVWGGWSRDDVPRDFVIREVLDTLLIVNENMPFPSATELTPLVSQPLSWSVGRAMPDYTDVVPAGTHGSTASTVQRSGSIFLSGKPLYLIKDVTVSSPLDPDADPTDGLIHFNVRVNTTPIAQVTPNNEYQVIVHNPESHQSMQSFTEIRVGTGTDPAEYNKYDGLSLKVDYETPLGFSTISEYVSNRQRRIGGDDSLVRAFHPVYLSCVIEYKLRQSALATIDEDAAAASVAEYINAYVGPDALDVSLISDYLRNAYPDIINVYPFTIDYDLHLPDGRVILFQTMEAVTVPSSVAMLRELEYDPDDAVLGMLNPLDYGVSDDTIRCRTLAANIQVLQRG